MGIVIEPTVTSSERLDKIVQVAAILFDRLGSHETSMDCIACEVGLKKSTLYHYVESEAEIVYQIHSRLRGEHMRRLTYSVRRKSTTIPE